MKVLVVRSVPLSRETRHGWKSVPGHDIRFARRDRGNADIAYLLARYNYEAVLNLGATTLDVGCFDGVVWNEAATVRAVSHANLRWTLNHVGMPDLTILGPHWHKRGGWGGQGAIFHENTQAGCLAVQDERQRHIEGDEYRVITVGDKVVQASRKVNCEWIRGRHNFEYEWCGVDGVRRNGIIPLVKSAVEAVPGGAHSVLGWDCIVADRPYIIECNTSPGVNEPTARRIVNAMETNAV